MDPTTVLIKVSDLICAGADRNEERLLNKKFQGEGPHLTPRIDTILWILVPQQIFRKSTYCLRSYSSFICIVPSIVHKI